MWRNSIVCHYFPFSYYFFMLPLEPIRQNHLLIIGMGFLCIYKLIVITQPHLIRLYVPSNLQILFETKERKSRKRKKQFIKSSIFPLLTSLFDIFNQFQSTICLSIFLLRDIPFRCKDIANK